MISTIPFDLLASEEFGALIGMKPDPAFQKLKVRADQRAMHHIFWQPSNSEKLRATPTFHQGRVVLLETLTILGSFRLR